MKTNLKISFIVSLMIVLLACSSCNKNEEECNAVIENSGIIISSVDISACNDPFYSGNFVIQSNQELDSVLNLNSGCNIPEIDFSSYTLLGRYAYTNGTGSYYRKVESDTANLRYEYTITVKTCEDCSCLNENMNWVLVPRLPDDWNVTFIVN